MGLDILLTVIGLMGWLGNSLHTPICSNNDLRVQRGSMPYEVMVKQWGRDEDCE